MPLRTSALLPLCLALLLAACGTVPSLDGQSGAVALEEANVPTAYHLSTGDKLQINVFGEPDLSGEFDVNEGGSITYPLLGQIVAVGRTVEELRQALATELNRNYLVNPKVSVEVLNYRPFFILGEVNNPGSYPYQSDMTVRQAVALAGGYTRRAVTSEMTLIRPTEDGEVELEVEQRARVLPGDTIQVERRFF